MVSPTTVVARPPEWPFESSGGQHLTSVRSIGGVGGVAAFVLVGFDLVSSM